MINKRKTESRKNWIGLLISSLLGLPATGKAIQHEITCGLGVDVVTATSGNMFDQMKMALQAERAIQNEILYRKGEMPENLP